MKEVEEREYTTVTRYVGLFTSHLDLVSIATLFPFKSYSAGRNLAIMAT